MGIICSFEYLLQKSLTFLFSFSLIQPKLSAEVLRDEGV